MIWAPAAWRVGWSTGTGELHWAAGGVGLAEPACPAGPEVALAAAVAVAGADATDW